MPPDKLSPEASFPRPFSKEMGAYYTKEDITNYIARNCIIPFLFTRTAQQCPAAFLPDGAIWQLLCRDPDRYIYDAIREGATNPLPPDILAGQQVPSQRSCWQQLAPPGYALPRETWREVIARRSHYTQIRHQLVTGQIHSIDQCITYNLNICRFAQDVIGCCTDPTLLYAFFASLEQLTILDPTCGSGAFLLAALHILEPLYLACFAHIHTFTLSDHHIPTQHRYTILKTILTQNLYGVDIMPEAVERCKRSLLQELAPFLAYSEDLPDLDKHIRTGNALAGSITTRNDISDTCSASDFSSHIEEPFHWHTAFPSIIQRGGFHVILGNPPYVEYERVRKSYNVSDYHTLSTGNLYALTIERSTHLLAPGGRFGMIVPSSATCTDGYRPLQDILLSQSALHIASFSDQRGRLFDIPHPRLCIILFQKQPYPEQPHSRQVFTTPYLKLDRSLRDTLFERLTYTEVTPLVRPGIIPRYGSPIEHSIHEKLHGQPHRLSDYLCKTGQHKVYYTRKLSWYVQVTPFVPLILDERGERRDPSELKTLRFASAVHADLAFVVLNSNLFYWFITTGSDCRNLNMREVRGFPIAIENIALPLQNELRALATSLAEDLQAHSEQRPMRYDSGTLSIQCIYPKRSKAIIDQIDKVLARSYGFTDEELDFLIYYDGKYR